MTKGMICQASVKTDEIICIDSERLKAWTGIQPDSFLNALVKTISKDESKLPLCPLQRPKREMKT